MLYSRLWKNHFPALLGLLMLAITPLQANGEGAPRVLVQTSLGDMVLELNHKQAPVSAANFLRYVDEGFYDGTIFHRVIGNFMIQGGGYDTSYRRKSTHVEIRSEANNGLKNLRGSIAMARTGNPHSATAQFFINVVDNSFLDHTAPTARGWGYTVFGRVVEGLEVMEQIRKVPTGSGGPFGRDVPQTMVKINSIKRVVVGAK